MKKNFLKWACLSLCAILLVACEKDDENDKSEGASGYSVLVVNQGNFSESNGSLSIIDANGAVTNQVYKKANGEALASIIESVVDCGVNWAILCNNEDKIEVVDKLSFKSVRRITGIVTPRYGVYVNGVLYVTSCDYNATDNHVYAVDLSDGSKKEIATIAGQPEGILSYGNYLWVAASSYNSATWSNYDPAVYRLNVANSSMDAYVLKGIQLGSKHLAVDADGSVWVSLAGYGVPGSLVKVDTTSKTLVDAIELPVLNSAGHVYASSNGKSVYCLASAKGSGSADEVCQIVKVDLSSKSTTTVAEGNGFYGFGVNPANDYVYSANVSGFTTNSVLAVYNAKGEKVSHDELLGVAACRFMFVK